MAGPTITINRAPVLTLWAAVVAERMGYAHDEALSLAKAMAGLNAQRKGRSLGIYAAKAKPEGPIPAGSRGEELWVELCGKAVPAKRTPEGLRAVKGAEPIDPEPVERYLGRCFGERYAEARAAMVDLAESVEPGRLAEQAFALYERFRPSVAPGSAGWGAAGVLDLELIRRLP
jgi:hypothetical protein